MTRVSRRSFIEQTSGATIALWIGISAKGNPWIIADADIAGNFTPYILVDSASNIKLFGNRNASAKIAF